MKLFRILFVALLLMVTGCKSTRKVATSTDLNPNLTSKQIIKEHLKKEAKFKTLQSRVKVEYAQGNSSQTHTINLRIEKDKIIWISATLGIIRVKITPTTVSFYNKLDNTYFDGDFSLISELLGAELNFQKIQNLLLGEALFDLKNEQYEADVFETSYVLKPKNQSELLEIFLLLNPSHFKMDSQQLAQPLERRMLQIDYQAYQEIEKQIWPQNIKIIALENDYETMISMEFKSISLNEDLRFPFHIPSGFQEIVIK